jgi:hypothetical protein
MGKTLVFTLVLLPAMAALALGEGNAGAGTLEVESPESARILLPEEQKQSPEALPGSYILPEAPGSERKPDKCMTVCARWGEECIIVNKGPGGMQRKCRRTCKQFAEECF